MNVIQSLFRRLFAVSSVAAQRPVVLGTDALKSVSGGNGGSTDAPRNVW